MRYQGNSAELRPQVESCEAPRASLTLISEGPWGLLEDAASHSQPPHVVSEQQQQQQQQRWCNRKQCSGGYPLKIVLGEGPQATSQEQNEVQQQLLLSLLQKLDWGALVQTAAELGMDLPPTVSESDKTDDSFLRAMQAAVLDFHILEGKLLCPTCKREYTISKGIPNMLLQDDEEKMCGRVSCTLSAHRLCLLAGLLSPEQQTDQQQQQVHIKPKAKGATNEDAGDTKQAAAGAAGAAEAAEAVGAACSACASLCAAGLLDASLLQFPINGCNIPPSYRLPLVLPPPHRSSSRRKVAAGSWGLRLPGSDLATPFNARIETAATKPAFRYCLLAQQQQQRQEQQQVCVCICCCCCRGLVNNRRCVVAIDGFFEWLRPSKETAQRKQPFFFRHPPSFPQRQIPEKATRTDTHKEACSSSSSSSEGGSYSCGRSSSAISVLRPAEAPLLMGCLYSPLSPDELYSSGNSTSSSSSSGVCFAVVTMDSKGTPMEPIHNRMPLLLSPEGAALWLDSSVSFSLLTEELKHQAKQLMCISVMHFPVTSSVGSIRTKGLICVCPCDPEEQQQQQPQQGAGDTKGDSKRKLKTRPLTAYFQPLKKPRS
ncbi:hypothetical protein Esti_002412 [Eimeria stiedai]